MTALDLLRDHKLALENCVAPIFPGRPGESFEAYMARSTAEFQRFLDANPNWRAPSLPREDLVNGLPRGGPGWGS